MDVFDVSLRDPILLVVLQHELVASIFLTCRRVALSLTILSTVALSLTILWWSYGNYLGLDFLLSFTDIFYFSRLLYISLLFLLYICYIFAG